MSPKPPVWNESAEMSRYWIALPASVEGPTELNPQPLPPLNPQPLPPGEGQGSVGVPDPGVPEIQGSGRRSGHPHPVAAGYLGLVQRFVSTAEELGR